MAVMHKSILLNAEQRRKILASHRCNAADAAAQTASCRVKLGGSICAALKYAKSRVAMSWSSSTTV
jgi:hypothetical protein